jgi:hypothetical protein
MHKIIDTNVLAVANDRNSAQASPRCVLNCVQTLQEIQQEHTVVIDSQWLVLREYMANALSEGQPGVGDAFLKWILTNVNNPMRCEQVPITPLENSFKEFPSDPDVG